MSREESFAVIEVKTRGTIQKFFAFTWMVPHYCLITRAWNLLRTQFFLVKRNFRRFVVFTQFLAQFLGISEKNHAMLL